MLRRAGTLQHSKPLDAFLQKPNASYCFKLPLFLRTLNFQHYQSFSTRSFEVKPPLVEKVHDLPECPYLPGAGVPLTGSVPLRCPVKDFISQAKPSKSKSFKLPSHPRFPNVVVLKLFDRRFVEQFYQEPWSSEGESGLHQRVKEFRSRGRCVMRATVAELFGLGTPDGKPADVESWIDAQFVNHETGDYSWSDMEPWEREVWMYEKMIERMRLETKMYVHLSALQGIRIPRLYGAVQCVLDGSVPGDDLITRVPGLMLEYVDGKTLRELHVGENISKQEAERVSQDVLSSVRELQKYRVLHGDIRRANIVVRDVDRKPFLIYFVDSDEYTNATEEEWSTVASGMHEIGDARRFLHNQGLHSPTPQGYRPSAFRNGFRDHNSEIESHDDAWRQRYVESIKVDGPTSEIRFNDEGKSYIGDFARWRFKPGVKTCDEDDE